MPSIQSLLKAALQEPRTLGREGGGDAGVRRPAKNKTKIYPTKAEWKGLTLQGRVV